MIDGNIRRVPVADRCLYKESVSDDRWHYKESTSD